jgi:hypothetical protein
MVIREARRGWTCPGEYTHRRRKVTEDRQVPKAGGRQVDEAKRIVFGFAQDHIQKCKRRTVDRDLGIEER